MKFDSRTVPLAPGLTREFLLFHRLCPKERADDGTLLVIGAEDALLGALDEIAFAYECRVAVETASFEEVERLVERMAAGADQSIEVAQAEPQDELTADVRDLANQPPVIRYVNLIIREAYDAGASDIHLEATREGLKTRLRLDGVLSPAPEPPADLGHAVVSRIKLLAELDIAERRRPQDGRIRVRLQQRELDVRVSTVPNLFGESVVLRLLDHGGRPVELADLGMSPGVLAEIERLTARAHGMLLVTGPTGSGKTTTLYAALRRRDASREKIMTVEDPVEYELDGITQVPVHGQAGVTFGSALRSILRQDPDVLMIGEMRDAETAQIAIQAALTGHFVFSTLHTNDAAGALPRMLDLGIPPYLVTATVAGILAQRLVRVVCPECAVERSPTRDQVARLGGDEAAGLDRVLEGQGCRACRGTGFRGRTGIFELLVMNEALKDAVIRSASAQELNRMAIEANMVPLRTDGWRKVQAEQTTIAEVLRVVEQ